MKIRFVFLYLFVATLSFAQQKPSQAWLDQKYSMFIHFGLYSEYGGVYDGKPVERGYSEQIQSFAGIFSDWYGNTSRKFNPEKWDADQIVALAKEAGMKSIVVTSKHHDGFCMYHSKYTDFNIVDATPYGRDLMKELSDACRRGGIEFAVYYSLIDWHFPQAYPISSHNADPLTPEHYQFNLKQVEEIMTRYGSISEIWFDMGSLTLEQSKGLYELVNRLQPQCMISGRLGNDYVDFAVMADNEYPDYKLDVPWQTAASIFDETWGYRSWQLRGEVQSKVNEKIASLIQVVSRGGNYLLNIGPRGDGSVVEFERDVLLSIGKWVEANGEAIYGTKANPLDRTFAWGEITTKDNTLYLFVKKEFAGKTIALDGFSVAVSTVNRLSDGSKVSYSVPKIIGKPYMIQVPQSSDEFPYVVLKVDFENGFTVAPSRIITGKLLTTQHARPVFGHSSLNYYGGYKTLIGYHWDFKNNRKSVVPELQFTDSEIGKTIELRSGDEQQKITLKAEGSKLMKLQSNTVKWGSLYRKPGRGVFGAVEEEGVFPTDAKSEDSRFKPVSDFEYGKTYVEQILPRASVVLLQEIESAKEQTIAVEVGCGNGAYVLLNGEYITAHLSPERIRHEKEIVLLPLKKGQNQLVVKLYNGYEKELNYSLELLEEWSLHAQKANKMEIGKELNVRSANPSSKVEPLRLSNLTIKL